MSLNYQRQMIPSSVADARIDYDLDEDSEIGNADNSRMYGDKYLVYRGPKNIEYFLYSPTASNSGNAGTSTDFTYFMPSRETVLDRCIYLKANITVQMVNNIPGAINNSALQLNKFGLKSFPLHQCIKVLQLQIDGNVYTIDLQSSFEYLKYYAYSEDEIKTWSSLCPSLLDNSSAFDTANTSNVLSAVDSGTSFVPPRGAFAFNSLVQTCGLAAVNPNPAVAAQSVVTYSVTEPIQLSPLVLNAIRQSKSTGLTGLSNIKIKITWRGVEESFHYGFNINTFSDTSALSSMVTNTVVFNTSPSVTITDPTFNPDANAITLSEWKCGLTIDNPQLILGVLTQNDVSIAPPINSYDFIKYDTYTDQTLLLKDNTTSFEVKSKSYNLSQIPHFVLFSVAPSKTGNNFTNVAGKTNLYLSQMPEWFFSIYNANLKLGNRSGLLSNCPGEMLYQMNRQNGLTFCNYSNSGMTNGRTYSYNAITPARAANSATSLRVPQGCPLLLQFGKDIAIDDASLAPGCAVNTTFQAILQCNNPYQASSSYTLTVIFIYCGIYTVSTTGTSYVTSPLSREDVLNSDNERVDSDELAQGIVSGGVFVGGKFGLFKKIGRFGKKVIGALKSPSVQRLIREAVDVGDVLGVPGASQVNSAIDAVETARDIARMRGDARGSGYGGVLNPSVISGGSAMGGSVLTAAQIRSRLMRR